jgi:hypothetical protein
MFFENIVLKRKASQEVKKRLLFIKILPLYKKNYYSFHFYLSKFAKTKFWSTQQINKFKRKKYKSQYRQSLRE